tara:strand:+ start:120 stop:728 length:609 start_codon:yes stop_codon:yes gene_type:complete
MPNWFYFSLSVRGKKEDVEQFVENVKGSEKYETEGREFDFNHFIPQPKNIYREPLSLDKEKELEKSGIPNWYTWNIDNWGTKWNAVCDDEESVGIQESPHEHTYRLRTAWSFPSPVISEMIDMYPNLDFEIEGEEESDSYGVYIVSSKEIWSEEEPTYVDGENDRQVYWDKDEMSYRYLDNDELVEDEEDFMPTTKYSWSEV